MACGIGQRYHRGASMRGEHPSGPAAQPQPRRGIIISVMPWADIYFRYRFSKSNDYFFGEMEMSKSMNIAAHRFPLDCHWYYYLFVFFFFFDMLTDWFEAFCWHTAHTHHRDTSTDTSFHHDLAIDQRKCHYSCKGLASRRQSPHNAIQRNQYSIDIRILPAMGTNQERKKTN